jgi:starch synthase
MRIVFAGPDLAAVADLAVAMQRLGQEVAALLPYDATAEGRTRPTRVRIPVAMGSRTVTGEILQASGPEKLPCYLVRPSEALPPDSAVRGVFHSQIAVELARRLIPSPDLLHLSGWETALAPAYVRLSNLPFRTVLELNDLSAQGEFEGGDFSLTQLPAGFFSPGGVEFYGRLNFLKGGLLLAHAFTVDGASTFTAFRAEPAAHGLGVVLAEQAYKCAPIRRPAQVSAWDPATDPFIAKDFSSDALDAKAACRTTLLAATGIRKKTAGPIFLLECGPEESGVGHLPAILDRWLLDEGKLIVLATGASVPAALETEACRLPVRICILRQPDEAMIHRAIAGADFQVFPNAPTVDFASAAWRAMRYGTIPVARDHIGRREVFDEREGLVWFVDSPGALWDTLGVRAAEIFRTADLRQPMRERTMRRAAAIDATSIAEAHMALYRQLGVA